MIQLPHKDRYTTGSPRCCTPVVQCRLSVII